MSSGYSALVADKFRELHDGVRPLQREGEKAGVHLAQILVRLRKTFAIKRTLRIGSYAKDTAIHRSDVDYMVVMSREEAMKWARDGSSATLVNRVREDLANRFPATEVRRDAQAVVVHFEQGSAPVDVVPAIFGSFQGTSPHYLIPDGVGDWIETSPDAQKTALAWKNAASGKKLVPVIRMLKWWAMSRQATSGLSSYYIEAFLMQTPPAPFEPYSIAVSRALGALYASGCAPAGDPVKISKRGIPATSTETQRKSVVSVLQVSAEQAAEAIELERRGQVSAALSKWRQVFNGKFAP